MEQQTAIDTIELQQLANRLFMFTDARNWNKLKDEVFTENVLFDMQSAGGGEPKMMKAEEICALWENGFKDIDAVHHQAGHYLVETDGSEAGIFGYAVATHYKQHTTLGKTRTFVGSYNMKAIKTSAGWRLNGFKYNLKYIDGNKTLE